MEWKGHSENSSAWINPWCALFSTFKNHRLLSFRPTYSTGLKCIFRPVHVAVQSGLGKERSTPLFTLRRVFFLLFNKNHLDELQGSIGPLHLLNDCVKPSTNTTTIVLLTTNHKLLQSLVALSSAQSLTAWFSANTVLGCSSVVDSRREFKESQDQSSMS